MQTVIVLQPQPDACFEPLWKVLRETVPQGFLFSLASLDDFSQLELPDPKGEILWLALEPHPEQFSTAEVSWFWMHFPLNPVWCVHSPWGESAGRNHQTWPLACRLPAHQAPQWFLDGWVHFQSTGRWPTALPWTAGREEIFSERYTSHRLPLASGCLLRIRTGDRSLRELWEVVWTTAGGKLALREDPADLVLFDLDPWSPDREAEWGQSHRDFPETTHVGITGEASLDWSQILVSTADQIIHKLWPSVWQFQQVLHGIGAHFGRQTEKYPSL